MIDLVTLVLEGGPLQYAILLLAGLGLPLTLLFGLASVRFRIPSAASMAVPAVMVAMGVFGTWLGLTQARMALAHASPEIVPVLAAAGLSVALYTTVLGGLLVGGLLLVQAVLAVVAAGPQLGDPEAVPTARTELVVGGCLAAATGSATWGWTAWWWGRSGYWSALSRAAPEVREVLMAAAVADAFPWVVVAGGVTVAALLAGTVALVLRQDTLTPRSLVGLGVSATLAVAMLALPGVNLLITADIAEAARAALAPVEGR